MTPFKKWIIVENTPEKLSGKILYYSRDIHKAKLMIDKAYDWVKTQNWENAVKIYLDLWGYDEKGNKKEN